MVVRRRKKYRKYVGTRYARRGYNDRNRGKGNKGGSGLSGWKFKKQKYHKIVKEYPELFEDKKGFVPPRRKEINAINLYQIEEKLDAWVEQGLVTKEGEYYVVDVTKLGYNKVLGRGRVIHKLKIITPMISEEAKRKVEEAGGIVEIKPL